MSRQFATAMLAGILIPALIGPIPAAAQAAGDPITTTLSRPSPAPAALEPEALQALDRMAGYLRNLKRFEVTSDGSVDGVFDDGQKLQFGLRTTYLVQAPHEMRVDIETDRQNRRIYYDGSTITIAGLVSRKYLSFPQTGTINEVLTTASDRFGITFPLQDLFRWGSPSSDLQKPQSGFKVGDARIEGKEAEHFAFRQQGVDFQLWIGKETPLPLKMVITNSEHAAQPQATSIFRWNLAPKTGSRDFTFTTEPGWQAVDLKALSEAVR